MRVLYSVDDEPELYSLAEMMDANEDDRELRRLLVQMQPGDVRDFGGGAHASFRIQAHRGEDMRHTRRNPSGRSWKVRGDRGPASLQIIPSSSGDGSVEIITNTTAMGNVEHVVLDEALAMTLAASLADLSQGRGPIHRQHDQGRIRMERSRGVGGVHVDVVLYRAKFALTPSQARDIATTLTVQSAPSARMSRKNPETGLHARIARALGWSVDDTRTMSLASLRDFVRPVDPDLAAEISEVIRGGHHVARGPRRTIKNPSREWPRDPAVLQYMETAMWSSSDDDGEPLDREFSFADVSPEMWRRAENDLRLFYEKCDAAGIDINDYDSTDIAHDFWLTRNGHGAGFWDGGFPKDGDKLTKIAKTFGEVDIYVGDDGKLYFT